MENLNEKLLTAWLSVSSAIHNERIVTILPFNEAHVCNLLYRRRAEQPRNYLTATDLCSQTRMLKSQMNKVLSSLEKRGMIERFPANDDRRKAYIRLRDEEISAFEKVHENSIGLVDQFIAAVGRDTAKSLAEELPRAAEAMDGIMAKEREKLLL